MGIMDFTSQAIKNLFSKPATSSYPQVARVYPEASRGHVEINIDDCIMCGACAEGCPVSAISEGDGKYVINADECISCGSCADVCPVGAPSEE